MQGSLAYKDGVLYVGTQEETAHVRSFDLDGHELEAGFDFRGPDRAPASVSGLAVDEDHRIWVADSRGGALRTFTLFGAEIAHVDEGLLGAGDHEDRLGTPVDVLSSGADDDQHVLVASGGRRRHAVQAIPVSGGRTRSLRPEGDPAGLFHGVRRVAQEGRYLWVCETGAARVQVFRDGRHHFSFGAPNGAASGFRPMALAPLPDGRLVLARGGAESALELLDRSGRRLWTLAGAGVELGCVHEPNDLALEVAESDRRSRLAVIDRDGDRVQVFNLEGRCYGAFPTFALGGS